MKKRALIVSGRGVQDQELIYPLYRLREAGYEVDLAAESKEPFLGFQGVKFQPSVEFANVDIGEMVGYRVLVIPGGVKAMEHMRLNKDLVATIADYHKEGGVIGAICSGAQMLISARLVKGRRISAYYAMRDDVENAGATFVDEPCVVDGRIVTSPHYKHLGPWMAGLLSVALNRA